MIKALLYIRLAAEPPHTYRIPLLETLQQELPGISSFEFDNHSEESTRHYALELVKQSGKLAVLVSVADAAAPIAGFGSLFNRLLKAKPESLLLVLQGAQPQLQKMMKAIAGQQFHENLSEKALRALLHEFFS